MESAAEELDVTRCDWRWAEWKPSDSIRHYPDGRTETIPGGWNHDHCLECRAIISDKGDGLRFAYYEDEFGNWLCPSCYERIVRPAQNPFS